MTSLTQPSKSKKSPESEFRASLRAVGVDWKAASAVLPAWAEHAYASAAGRLELRGFLTRHFGLALDQSGNFARGQLPEVCFKTTSNTSPDEVDIARAVATACSRIVANVTVPAWRGVDKDPVALRGQIVKHSPNGWVDLKSLLEFCWKSGVPVLYLPSLLTSGKKMEGMVTYVSGRPAIVISKRSDQPDWILFTLAHELGHVALKHLPETEGQAIVDDTVERKATDEQEKEANDFALSLLTSRSDGLVISSRLPKAAELAAGAIAFGREHGISPGHVILNAVSNTKVDGRSVFPLGQAALKLLPVEITGGTTPELCREAARPYLETDALKHDSFDYLEKLGIV